MLNQYTFLICPDCDGKIRQLMKDIDRIRMRVCSACGASINVKEALNTTPCEAR